MNESRGYTGHMLEEEVLGEMHGQEKKTYEHFLPTLDQRPKLFSVINVVEISQRNICTTPQRYFSKKVRIEVGKRLGLDLENDPNLVEFYTAVGTILDTQFGTDAFLRIKEPGTKFNALVTLDVTENPHKDRHKANVIVLFPDGSKDPMDPKERVELDAIISKTVDEICLTVEQTKKKFFGDNYRKIAA